MNSTLGMNRVSVTPLRVTGRPRGIVIRCAYNAPRDVTPKKIPRQGAVMGAHSTCNVNRKKAHEFNQCFINFEQLDEENAARCLSVANEIVEIDCNSEICDEDICTDKEQVDWFRAYVSNAFGI